MNLYYSFLSKDSLPKIPEHLVKIINSDKPDVKIMNSFMLGDHFDMKTNANCAFYLGALIGPRIIDVIIDKHPQFIHYYMLGHTSKLGIDFKNNYEDVLMFTRSKPIIHQSNHFFAVSHRWETKENPDPNHTQLRKLNRIHKLFKEILNDILNYRLFGIPITMVSNLMAQLYVDAVNIRVLSTLYLGMFRSKDVNFWYDYYSLKQKPRTIDEEKIFQLKLLNINNIYKNNPVVVINTDDYMNRGWCIFEYTISSCKIRINESKDSFRIDTSESGDIILKMINMEDPLLEMKLECTNGDDLIFLNNKLKQVLFPQKGWNDNNIILNDPWNGKLFMYTGGMSDTTSVIVSPAETVYFTIFKDKEVFDLIRLSNQNKLKFDYYWFTPVEKSQTSYIKHKRDWNEKFHNSCHEIEKAIRYKKKVDSSHIYSFSIYLIFK